MPNATPAALIGRRTRLLQRNEKSFDEPQRNPGMPFEALREALDSGRIGEVVVRRGERVGRIYVSEGRIAWAHNSDGRVCLLDIVRGAGVTPANNTCIVRISTATGLSSAT